MAMENKSHTLSSIEKTFEIIEYLDREGPAGATQVAADLGYHKTTVHSHLRTLHSIGYTLKKGGEYELSLQFFKHGGSIRNELPIFREGKEEVQDLANDTGELVNLAVEQTGRIVVIFMVEGENAIHDEAPVGKHTWAHSTALGKTMLAYYPPNRIHEILDEGGMPAFTENTITDRDALFRELEETRDRGFAIDNEEGKKGIKCIAAPIFTAANKPIGALSITGPKARLSDEGYHERLTKKIKSVANVIEVKLEYHD